MSEENQNKKTMSKKDKRAFEYANKAFELIGQHQTPPYPSTYALWYAYAAKSNQEIVKTVDSTLASSGELSVYDINQIHDTYLVQNEDESARNEKIANHYENEMAAMMQLLQKSLTNSDNYSNTLDAAQEQLPDAVTPEKVGEIVSHLIAQNQEMKSMTEELNNGITKSQSQIQELNAQLAEARAESLRDGLTKLANRRAFDERLAKEVIKAETGGTKVCLVLADIDHFKKVNDTYGHQVGDGILQTFASLISKNVKGGDLAARYGGEEFALILPETTVGNAFNLVEKIRVNLEASRLVIKSTGQSVGKVTSSFGISVFQPGMTVEQLIRRADEKLYDAKNNGRNRIEIDQDTSAAA